MFLIFQYRGIKTSTCVHAYQLHAVLSSESTVTLCYLQNIDNVTWHSYVFYHR
jgi:hypothetical protein